MEKVIKFKVKIFDGKTNEYINAGMFDEWGDALNAFIKPYVQDYRNMPTISVEKIEVTNLTHDELVAIRVRK